MKIRVRAMLRMERASVLVSSAACGADLIALEQAGLLGLRRRVVLPFAPDRFRKGSVTDRPGQWGAIYDSVMSTVTRKEDLVVLPAVPEELAYSAASLTILDEAQRLAEELQQALSAALVWEGVPRGAGDRTQEFAVEARRRGIRVVEVATTTTGVLKNRTQAGSGVD